MPLNGDCRLASDLPELSDGHHLTLGDMHLNRHLRELDHDPFTLGIFFCDVLEASLIKATAGEGCPLVNSGVSSLGQEQA